MEANVAASPQARDADGNALMSLEELKENMFHSIRDNGTVELIRAQLRRRFIEKLQQQRHSNNERDDGENDASCVNRDVSNSTPDEKLAHGLVAEYLATKGLENTLAVFVPEIGGSRNQMDSATILEMLHVNSSVQSQLEMQRANTGHSLLLVLVQELVRRFQLATMDSGTQTAMDCFDHRIVLDNQLRRVENAYLAECAAQKLEPQKSLEERMVQYQREYDDICDKRLQEELERYKSTEVALVRAEERKRFVREVDSLRSSLLQEYRSKQDRLQERERELELAFVGRRTELETSLFETRQSLFKDMERLRVKEAELQVKVESDFRHFASETQRFQLWEESVRTQEANLEGIVAQAMREKERSWQIERQQALHDIQTKQDELADREQSLTTETGTLKTLKTQVLALQQEGAALEAALSKSGDDLRVAQNLTVQLEKDRLRLEERVTDTELQLGEQKNNLNDANTANARLMADKSLVNDELSRYRQKNTEIKEQMKLLAGEVKVLQQQVLDMKLDEANAIVVERKRFMQLMDEERDRFQWKENELLAKVREMQSRLAESEAAAEKYQSQYEDEKVHVESLRHDVASLNSLLTQAQATINAKHGAPRDIVSFRAQRSAANSDTFDSGSPDYQIRGGNERTFMMKMMEMMTNFQDERDVLRVDNRRDRSDNPAREAKTTDRLERVVEQSTAVLAAQLPDEDKEEAQRLKEDQLRIERELLEQREYEKKKQARMEEQERELAEQHKQFEENFARRRQERIEEEEKLEKERKRKQAEEEVKLQEQLTRQRAAVQEATQLQQNLAEQRLVDEQQRLQDEQSYREKRLAEERQFREEIEAMRQEQTLETAQQQEREAEEERLRLKKTFEEQERTRLETEQTKALQEARQKQEKEDRLRGDALRLAEEEGKRKEEEDAERTMIITAAEDASWQESSVEVDDADSNAQPGTNVVEVCSSDAEDLTTTGNENTRENRMSEVSPCEIIPATDDLETDANNIDPDQEDNEVASDTPVVIPELPATLPEQEEQELPKTTEEAKKQEDENVIDVYRQRVLARKAAEKQRQLELEAAESERKTREEEERVRQQLLGDASESDHELELSGGSFAESSAASNSDSF
ncbi:hypothetical protein PRNP1_011169 [Phytophthora ramorum]